MGTNAGARVARGGFGKLTSRLTLAADLVSPTVEMAMLDVAESATQIMENRIRNAETDTGHKRVAGGGESAGRIETGLLISTLRNPDGTAATVESHATNSGNISMNFGYHEDTGYTRAQEFEDYSVSGVLGARQMGFNYFVQHAFSAVADDLDDMVRNPEANKFRRRARTYQAGSGYNARRSAG